MSHSRLLIWGLSLAVVGAVAAARPAAATAQDVPIVTASPEATPDDREATLRGLGAPARPDVRIAFGVRRGAIQHVVTPSPFDDVYSEAVDPSETVTLVTIHRFGQRAPGGVRLLSNTAPATLRLGPSEEPLRLGPHPPIVWNLAERIRIAFGGRARSLSMIDPGLEHGPSPIGTVTIEFGDRR